MSTQGAAAIHSPLEVPGDHPSYAGHFPKFPVLPGAALLDEALQVMQRAWDLDLTQWQIASAKFFDAVRPGDTLSLQHHPPQDGLIRFTVRAADRTVAGGSLRSAVSGGGA